MLVTSHSIFEDAKVPYGSTRGRDARNADTDDRMTAARVRSRRARSAVLLGLSTVIRGGSAHAAGSAATPQLSRSINDLFGANICLPVGRCGQGLRRLGGGGGGCEVVSGRRSRSVGSASARLRPVYDKAGGVVKRLSRSLFDLPTDERQTLERVRLVNWSTTTARKPARVLFGRARFVAVSPSPR